MAHQVTCNICKKKFDRDKESYVKISERRYAHAACALREAVQTPGKPEPLIIDPTEIVTCIYCKQKFNRVKEPCEIINTGKYAHKKCFELEQKRELTDEEKLNKYIRKIFNIDYVPPHILKQEKEFIEKYNFSYSGMLKALIYGCEIKKTVKIDLARPTIGIIPYIYQDAYNYYYSLWLAEQINAEKDIKSFVPKVEKIQIFSPQRQEMKKHSFKFLMEEEINGN